MLTRENLARLIKSGDADTLAFVRRYLDLMHADTLKANFRKFVEAFWPLVATTPLQPGWYLDALCDHLQHLTELKRLIINIPPRLGKSTLTAVLFVAWLWASRPQTKFLCSTYSLKLSLRDSLHCRTVIESPLYQSHFGDVYQLLTDQNQKARYENDKLGLRLSTSTSSGNTGEGCDVLIADDLNDVNKAQSAADRQAVIDWWTQVMSTRMNPDGLDCKVLIQQRCAYEDITGHITKEDVNKDWTYLVLPWEFESSRRTVTPIFTDPRTSEGEPLCGLYKPEKIAELKGGNGLGPTGFATQFQQRPAAIGGNVFKGEWFKRYQETPDAYLLGTEQVRKEWCSVFVTTDLAISLKASADFTVAQAWAITPLGHLLLLDQFRGKVEGPEAIKAFKAMCSRFQPDALHVEDVAFQRLMIQMLKQEGLPVKRLNPQGQDKKARSQRAQVKGECGMVWLPERPWVKEWLDEVTTFPSAAHDDQVDCLSWAAILSTSYPVRALPEVLTPEDRARREEEERRRRENEFLWRD